MIVGAASKVQVHTFLYPRGTEFLHTVRYVGVDPGGSITTPPRMKEVRYMLKHTFVPKHALAGLYDDELQEKIEAEPPYFADFRDKGLDNGFGWRLQGYIEDARGDLRPNSYEETLFCMGCHSTIGTTIDHTFAFARKVTDAQVADARAVRERFGERFRTLLGEDGLLILPAMPDVAPLLSESEESLDAYRNKALNLLCLSGLARVPQVSVPLASRLGAPLGLSLIGPVGSDLSLVRLAARLREGI